MKFLTSIALVSLFIQSVYGGSLYMDGSDCFGLTTYVGEFDTYTISARHVGAQSGQTRCSITLRSTSSAEPRLRLQTILSRWNWSCFNSVSSRLRVYDSSSTRNYKSTFSCASTPPSTVLISSERSLTLQLDRSSLQDVNFNFQMLVMTTAETNGLAGWAVAIIVSITVGFSLFFLAVILCVCRRRRRRRLLLLPAACDHTPILNHTAGPAYSTYNTAPPPYPTAPVQPPTYTQHVPEYK